MDDSICAMGAFENAVPSVFYRTGAISAVQVHETVTKGYKISFHYSFTATDTFPRSGS